MAAAGVEAMKALCDTFGGLTLYLPKPDYLDKDHPITRAMGLKAAQILCRDFGPGEIDVPMGPRGARSLHRDIRRLEDTGNFTHRAIARMCGTTERHVRRVLNATGDPRQTQLFD